MASDIRVLRPKHRPIWYFRRHRSQQSRESHGAYFTNDQFSRVTTGGAPQGCSSDTAELYDQVGRLFRIDQSVACPSATNPSPAPLRTSHAYDIGDRLKAVKQFDPVTQTIIQQREFNYDNRGVLTSEKHPDLGTGGNGLVTYSGYDARGHAGRKQDGVSDLTFEYDRAERMTRVRETGTFIGCGTTTQPRCLKEFTFGTANSGSDLRLGKVQVAKRYNYRLFASLCG